MAKFRNPRENDPPLWWINWLLSPTFRKLWVIRRKFEKDGRVKW